MSKIRIGDFGYPIAVLGNGSEIMRGQDCQHTGLHWREVTRLSYKGEAPPLQPDLIEGARILDEYYSQKAGE